MLALFLPGSMAGADGLETFNNETASSTTYGDGSFTGNNAIVWSFIQSRDATADAGAYAIDGAGLILRRASSSSKLVSASIEGGIQHVSVKLKKAFTGAGTRQVGLYLNGISYGSSEAFDDTTVRTFTVTNLTVSGPVIIEIRNLTESQVVIDDLAWTSLSGADDPNIAGPSALAFGEIPVGTIATQSLSIVNAGTSQVLVISGVSPASGDTDRFNSPTAFPVNIPPNGASGTVAFVYLPGAATGMPHAAVFNLLSNDPSDPVKPVALSGRTPLPLLTVSNIQYVTGSNSNSPYLSQTVTVQGVCTYVDVRGYAVSDPGGGPWSGVYVADPDHAPEPGDLIHLQGRVIEFQNYTMMSNLTAFSIASSSNPLPPPANVSAATARQEAYEGVIVSISNVVVSNERTSTNTWQISDGTSTIEVLHDSSRRLYRYVPASNNTLRAISGIIWQSGSAYRIQVRDDDDFVGRPVVQYALRGMVITPDGPRTNWFVQLYDDDIVYVGNVAPTVTVYETGGIIFPGLIDTHNHQGWNSFPTLQFNNAPYGHRDAWAADAEYSDWTGRRTTVRNHASVLDNTRFTIGRYGELLEMMAGCIAIQGMSYNMEYAHPCSGIMNLEAFPARIDTDIFPWQSTAADRTGWTRRIEGGAIKALLIHLSEGTSEVARAQFDTWYNWGMLNKATTIIHGVPYGTNELDKIAAAGASIVWSPKSNMKLYHGTANIPLYKARGVNIALAPDWTASGSYNMLEELGYAWRLNQTIFTNALTARDLVDMATINAAKASGIDTRYGKIAAGYNAGLVVIQHPGGDPYEALLQARPRTVLLTIIDGTPRYGDAAMMNAMGFTGETVNAWGTSKVFHLVRNHPFLNYENDRVSDIITQLAAAHGTLTTTGELETEELQFLGLHLLQSGPDNIAPFVAQAPLIEPLAGRAYTNDLSFALRYRSQDFWDNDTDHFQLVHKQIALVPVSQPTQVLQVIAQNVTNTVASQTINFNVNFRGLFTNYYLRFLTADLAGSVRTALITSAAITIKPAAYDQDNDDLIDSWEQQIVNFDGADTYASIFDVLPSNDFDADGYSEEQEQHAGTIPVNSGSYFKVAGVAPNPGVNPIVFTWSSTSNRTYAIFGMSNLSTGVRIPLASGIPATPPLNTYTSSVTSSDVLFYLLGVE